jgi:hypothetical protein
MLDLLDWSHGWGVQASVNKRKSQSGRAARRKIVLSRAEPTIEPTPTQPVPDTEPPPNHVPAQSSNGDEETALARLADDGAPPAPPTEEETPLPAAGPLSPPPVAVPVETLSLEQRVRRLEEALSSLQQQRAGETRVTAPPANPPSIPTAVLLDAGKRLLGAAAQAVTATPPPDAAGGTAAPGPARGAGPSAAAPMRVLWLLWDAWAEARVIVRMFVDPRYRLPWSARVLPLLLLAAFLIDKKYWVPGAQIPFLGDVIFSKIIDLLLAFVLFKWLGHEARRYRQTSPDLPPSLRL